MDEALSRYLSSHRAAVNVATATIARGLADPDDTDRDMRRLVRDSRAALHAGIAAALKAGPVEGARYGMAGEVVVAVRVPRDGMGTLGRLNVSVGRLNWGPMIPCPDDWPQSSLPLPEAVKDLGRMLFPAPEGSRIVEADAGGYVGIGESNAGSAYMLTDLPEGEIWLRPLDAAEDQEA